MALEEDPTSLWFLNTLVKIRVPNTSGGDGISIMEHRAPVGDSPPLHVHRNQDEGFVVLDGEIRVNLDGQEIMARTESTLLAPKGIPHSYKVISADGARFLTITRGPDFEGLVRFLGRPAGRDELPVPSGPPSPEQAARLVEICASFGIDLVGPPLA
ncbi:MAG: cupin domain-containing protein [Hyphomicrobiales bacterium]